MFFGFVKLKVIGNTCQNNFSEFKPLFSSLRSDIKERESHVLLKLQEIGNFFGKNYWDFLIFGGWGRHSQRSQISLFFSIAINYLLGTENALSAHSLTPCFEITMLLFSTLGFKWNMELFKSKRLKQCILNAKSYGEVV